MGKTDADSARGACTVSIRLFGFICLMASCCLSGQQTQLLTVTDRAHTGFTRLVSHSTSEDTLFTVTGMTLTVYCRQNGSFVRLEAIDWPYFLDGLLDTKSDIGEVCLYGTSDSLLFVWKFQDQRLELEAARIMDVRFVPWYDGSKTYRELVRHQDVLFVLGYRGVSLIDISNRGEPVLLAPLIMEGTLGTMYKERNHLYATIGVADPDLFFVQKLLRYDIENPWTPALLATYQLEENLIGDVPDHPIHSIVMKDDRLFYLYDGSLVEKTLGDSSVVHQRRIALNLCCSSEASEVTRIGERILVDGRFPGGIYVFDITQKDSLVELEPLPLSRKIADVWVDLGSGTRLMLTADQNGVEQYDISDLKTPRLTAESWPTGYYAQDVDVVNNKLFICDGRIGVSTYDLSPPTHPTFESSVLTGVSARSFTVNPLIESLAYVTTGSFSRGGLYTLDLSDTPPTVLSFFDAGGGALTFFIYDSTGYLLSTRQNAIHIFDLSIPQDPEHLSAVSLSGTPRSMIAVSNVAYVAYSRITGDGGIQALDINDPRSPFIINDYQISDFSNGVSDLDFVDDDHIVLVDFHEGLAVLNISDYENMHIISRLEAGGRSVRVNNGFAFVAGPGAVHIVSMKDLTKPELVGSFPLVGGAFPPLWRTNIAEDLAIQDSLVYVAGGPTGLYVLKLDETLRVGAPNGWVMPSVFFLGQPYPNPFNPATMIEFSVPRSEVVTLSVYDLLGREVETILKRHMSPGRHKVEWNAGEVPSGIYFVKMRAGDFIKTRKVTVLR